MKALELILLLVLGSILLYLFLSFTIVIGGIPFANRVIGDIFLISMVVVGIYAIYSLTKGDW